MKREVVSGLPDFPLDPWTLPKTPAGSCMSPLSLLTACGILSICLIVVSNARSNPVSSDLGKVTHSGGERDY